MRTPNASGTPDALAGINLLYGIERDDPNLEPHMRTAQIVSFDPAFQRKKEK